jgi:ABC-type transporter Mla subunit MlaD
MGIGDAVRLGISTTMRAVDVALALPRIAIALERLADATDDVRRLAVADPARQEDLLSAIAAITRIGDMAATIGPLGDAVKQLNTAASALTTTMTPLQGASERLGRFVDRLPAKPRRTLDIDADLA